MPSPAAPQADPSATSPAPTAPLQISATLEQVLVATSVFWALSANRSFLAAALAGRTLDDLSAWGFAAALFVLLVALHLLLLLPLASRWTVKPLLAVLIVATAAATHFMRRYGIYLDPEMVRNVLHSDPGEARELLSGALALHLLLYAGLPLLLLWRVRLVRLSWRRTLLLRLGLGIAAAAVAIGTLLAVFQPFAALMRTYQIILGNSDFGLL